jgi:hypothetical protein
MDPWIHGSMGRNVLRTTRYVAKTRHQLYQCCNTPQNKQTSETTSIPRYDIWSDDLVGIPRSSMDPWIHGSMGRNVLRTTRYVI